MTKMDPRVLRTKTVLLNAIRELTIDIGINNLTILNIAKRAGINRSTFYLHFENKEEAIKEMIDEILEDLEQAVQDGDYKDINQAHENYYNHNKPYTDVTKMFKHIYQFNEIYKILIDDQSFQKNLVNIVSAHLSRALKKDSELSFFTYGTIGLIQYWLDNGMKESIEEISLELTRITIDFAIKEK